jgi:uncharacterized protein YjgD (DUF1641 family)
LQNRSIPSIIKLLKALNQLKNQLFMSNLLSNMFAKQTEEATRQWAQQLTLEQIEEYERQGMDMAPYRLIREEYLAEIQKKIDTNKAFLDFSKLDKYKRTPRSAEDNFINDVAEMNGITDKNKQLLETAPLVYGRVVQANSALFTPNKDEIGATAMVLLFAFDDAHRYNEEWLAKTAKKIIEMRDKVDEFQPQGIFFSICRLFELTKIGFIANMIETKKLENIPADCREFIKTLLNFKSSFYFPLGSTVSEGADAWCATFWLDKPSKLPMNFIPYSRIIPLLVSAPPQQYNPSFQQEAYNQTQYQQTPYQQTPYPQPPFQQAPYPQPP